MAKKYTIQLEVDDSGAIKNVDKLAGELDTAAGSAQNLKQQLREMQQQISSLDSNSEEFQKLSREAGELKDRIKDASEAINNQAGSSFERLSNNAGQLKDSLLNLDFEQVGSSLQGIAGTVKGFTFKEFGDGLKNVTSGIGALGKALLTNPLFLLLTGITLVVANFEKIVSLIDGVTDAETKGLEIQKERAATAKESYDRISATEETLKRQGMTEKQITDLKITQLNTAIAEQQAVVQTTQIQAEAQIKAAERNAEYLKTFLDFVTFPQRKLAEFFQNFVNGAITVLNKLGLDVEKIDITSVFEDVNNFVVKQLFDPEAERKNQEKIVADAQKSLEDLINTRDSILNAEDAKNKARRESQAKEREAERKRQADVLLQIEKDTTAAIEAELKKRNDAEAEANRKKLDALVKANEERIKREDELFELEQSINQTQTEKEIADVVAKYEKLFEIANGNAELEKQLAAKQAEEIGAITQQSSDQQVQVATASFEQKLKLGMDLLQSFGDLVGSFNAKSGAQAKRQFEITKGVNIALALANTYLGATAAYNSQLLPGDPTSPFRAFAAAAAAVAAGLANVNRIRQQKFQGGGSDSGGGGGGGGSVGGQTLSFTGAAAQGGSVAQFNPVNTDFVNNRPDQVSRAYVLATDVRSGVEASEKVEQQARL